MSRYEAFVLPHKWDGINCLLPVDVEVIREIKQAMGGDELLEFTTREYRQKAQAVYDSLHIKNLTLDNAWDVFNAMLPLMHE